MKMDRPPTVGIVHFPGRYEAALGTVSGYAAIIVQNNSPLPPEMNISYFSRKDRAFFARRERENLFDDTSSNASSPFSPRGGIAKSSF